MVRAIVVAGACFVVALTGAVQVASSAAYGDLAAPFSLPAALHALAPGLLRPFIGGTYARAAAAVHDGDVAQARRLVAPLGDGAAAADLRGQIAELGGERDAAIAQYVRARDVVRAQTLIDVLARTDRARALAYQGQLVTRLSGDANASEVTGQAWWRLGELQAAVGNADSARRTASWADAERSYERALALAPNEETYLLAAGYQSLVNGDGAAAQRWYARAADVVPNSADAYAGLAWTHAARNDCAAARGELARARALRGAETTVRDPVDDPNVGPALKRCAT